MSSKAKEDRGRKKRRSGFLRSRRRRRRNGSEQMIRAGYAREVYMNGGTDGGSDPLSVPRGWI